jgi:hypothetical protein
MTEQGERIGVAAAEGYRLVVLDQDPDEDTSAQEAAPAAKRT